MDNTVQQIQDELDKLAKRVAYHEQELKRAKEKAREENFKIAKCKVEQINTLILDIQKLGFTIDLQDYSRRESCEVSNLECDEQFRTITVNEI